MNTIDSTADIPPAAGNNAATPRRLTSFKEGLALLGIGSTCAFHMEAKGELVVLRLGGKRCFDSEYLNAKIAEMQAKAEAEAAARRAAFLAGNVAAGRRGPGRPSNAERARRAARARA